MRAIASIPVLLAMAGTAQAQATFSLHPAQGQNGQAVNLRVDEPSGCTPFTTPTILRQGESVKVSFEINDSVPPGPCPADRVAPRLHSLGTFATGNYTIEVSTCSNAPMPPFCFVRATLDLSVFGSNGQRFTVPTLSGAVIVGLIFALMVLGVIRQPRAGG